MGVGASNLLFVGQRRVDVGHNPSLAALSKDEGCLSAAITGDVGVRLITQSP